jgi:magnesium chelatase family protein
MSDDATALVEAALRSGRLSARGLHRVRRVARTIADLDGVPDRLSAAHVAGALGLRLDPTDTVLALPEPVR